MADKILSPEIVKLMDKITQNPTSRLFVPLAEEYLKADMVEEAIIVLVEGIKNHPNYVAARVMLGKIYLQKNQIPEAQAEFEQVILVNPENILAHKKLALIYQGQGQPQKALEACKKVLAIDPSDKEAKGLVAVLEKTAVSAMQAEKEVDSPSSPAAAEASPAAEAPIIAADSPSEVASPVSIASSNPITVIEEAPAEVPPAQPEPIPSEIAPPVGEVSAVSLELANDPFHVQPEPIVPSVPEEISEAAENAEKENGASIPMGEAISEPLIQEPVNMEASGTSPSKGEDVWEEDKTVVAGFSIPPPRMEASPSPEDQQEAPLFSTTLASLYMSQGHYKEAAEVYEKLLERDASDEECRQGLEKALQHLAPLSNAEVSTGASHPEDSKQKKLRRLQSWLDSIRKKE